jgi:hypothetical protein
LEVEEEAGSNVLEEAACILFVEVVGRIGEEADKFEEGVGTFGEEVGMLNSLNCTLV